MQDWSQVLLLAIVTAFGFKLQAYATGVTLTILCKVVERTRDGNVEPLSSIVLYPAVSSPRKPSQKKNKTIEDNCSTLKVGYPSEFW